MHRQPGAGGPRSSTRRIFRRGARQILPGAGVHYSEQPASPHGLALRAPTARHIPRARGWAGGREGAPNPKLGINARTRRKRHFSASARAPRTKSLRDLPRGVCGATSVHGNALALRAKSVGRVPNDSSRMRTRAYVTRAYPVRDTAACSVRHGVRQRVSAPLPTFFYLICASNGVTVRTPTSRVPMTNVVSNSVPSGNPPRSLGTSP